jgi:hypothetical protein
VKTKWHIPNDYRTEVASRMRSLREAMFGDDHGSQKSFADFLGISVSRLNNYELAKRVPDYEMKRRLLSKIPGLTIDWIETGNTSGLTGLPAACIPKHKKR